MQRSRPSYLPCTLLTLGTRSAVEFQSSRIRLSTTAHIRTASADRSLGSVAGISRRLMLHLRINFRSQQYNERGNIEPQEEDHDSGQRAIRFVIIAKTGNV